MAKKQDPDFVPPIVDPAMPPLDNENEKKEDAGKVKVKFLRQVGPYAAGQEAEVDAELAEQLCAESMQQHNGHLHNLQKAIKMSELAKLKDAKIDVTFLTQVDMDAAGLVNRVPSPYDTHPTHEASEIGEKADKIKAEYAKKNK